MLKHIIAIVILMACCSCDGFKNIPEAKNTGAIIQYKCVINEHEYFECCTYGGRMVIVHNPDCEKCQKNLEDTIRKVINENK